NWRMLLTPCICAEFTGSSSIPAQMQGDSQTERRSREMSTKKRKTAAGGREIRVRSIQRDPPDIKKLSRALIALAMAQAQAEADAQAEHDHKAKTQEPPHAA